MRRTGIIVATDGKTIRDEPLSYSSNNSHLLVDTSPSKKHLDIFETNGGSVLTVSTGGSVADVKEFVFHKIDHGLNFIPKVSAKFLIRQGPATLSGFEGLYASYLIYGGVPFSESIFYRVDSKSVHFVHEAFALAGGPVTVHNSIMQDILFRIKYSIYLNEGLDEPYDSRFILS